MDHELVRQTELLRVEALPSEKTIIARRLGAPARSVDALTEAYRDALAGAERYRGWALLLDVRATTGNNDPDFERQMHDLQALVEAYFSPVVLLVATAAGALQGRRLNRERGHGFLIVDSEEEALRLCRGEPSGTAP